MAKGKKFDCLVMQENDVWIAQIVRRVTSKETVVSKTQGGFASEADAKAWGEEELKSFLKSLNERNQRRTK